MSGLIYCYAECRYVEPCYAACRYAKCCYAECRYAERCYGECRGGLFEAIIEILWVSSEAGPNVGFSFFYIKTVFFYRSNLALFKTNCNR